MDEEEDETSSFRPHVFDLSIKRSNSSPALPLLVNSADNDMQFDDVDFCDSKLRRHSSSFSSHPSRLSRFAHIMKNELTNPIVDEASQERDLHDNLKMSISFTDLAVGDEQQPQQPSYTIDSRRSSVNSSDSSNLCYSSSPSPSTPARPCAVVSNQRQCYSPALQQQVAPFQCYLASPPSRSQSPISMMTNNTNSNSSSKMTSFPPNLKRKQGDDSTAGLGTKKSRIGSDNESLFGPTNSPESPSPGSMESSTNLLTTQQSLNLLSSIPPSLSSSSSTSNGNDNTHFKPIQHSDNDVFPPPNSPSTCPSPTNSTCSSSSSLTFTPISPASTTSSSSSSFLLLPTNFNRSTVIPSGLIVPSATKQIAINPNYTKLKVSTKNQFQRDDSSSSSLQPLSVLLPRARIATQDKSTSPTSEQQFFFSSDDNNSPTAQ
jgi:hypothetical protein